MNNMTATLETHPLAVGSDGYKHFLFLEGKVNSQSSADDHESVYNVKFTTTLGFTLTMGYSRYKDQVGTTHAWIAFGEFCSSPWQKELGVDLLLNLVGYRCVYGSSATAPPSQPLAGGASSVAPPSQPLAGFPLMQEQDQAKEQEDEGKDETDHEGLDVRPCLGEQDPDAQPWAGGASSVAPASQSFAGMPCAQPPASMVASSATAPAPAQQPLAGSPLMQDQAKEQEDEGKDETDHEGLYVQPCLGEQDPDGASSAAPTSQSLAGMPCA